MLDFSNILINPLGGKRPNKNESSPLSQKYYNKMIYFYGSQMKNRLCGKASVGLTLDPNTILAFFPLERAQEKT